MPPDPSYRSGRESPPARTGGDQPDTRGRMLYEELTDDLLYDPAVGRATMMGYPCVRLAGRFLACFDATNQQLVVKVPRERVTELVDGGAGNPFAPAGKVFREWVAIPEPDRDLWQQLLAEAVEFARLQLND